MQAGKLRRRITLQRRENRQDPESGALIPDWQDIAAVWAQISPLSAREAIQAAAYNSKIAARIVIRYRAGIDAAMRIVHRGKIYDIQGVIADRDSGKEYLTLPVSVSEGENHG